MKKYRVEVKNSHEANEAQSLFWLMGYGKAYFSDSRYPKYVVTNENNNTTGADIGYAVGEQITLDQLRTMAKKEYLDENYNLVHHKTDIEVPVGAETATISKEKRIEFWKDGGVTWWCSEDKEWEILGTLQSHIDNCGYVIGWQRTHSADVVDNVNHPTHYTSGSVECIEAIESSMSAEAFKGFLKGNVQKYMWRYEQKGGAESLEKAQWYLNLLLSRVSS